MKQATAWTFDRPHRTLGMRLFNGVGRLLRRGCFCRHLSADAVLAAARRHTGLADFGDEEPLRVLLASFEDDAHLTPLGRLLLRLTCTHLAATRLRLRHALPVQPEALARPIARPLFVVGLPRTGTTLLHNLLCQDARARPLLLWEALEPVRPPGKKDRRPTRARRLVTLLDRFAVPRLRAVHPLDAGGPEECTFLLLNTFQSPAFLLNGRVTGYVDWLRARGPAALMPVYEDYRQQLQLLQLRGPLAPRVAGDGEPPGHWVLKSPVHAFGLDALLSLFPDACVVQTHRAMNQVVPSTCSLFALTRGLYSDDVDPRRLGPEVVQFLRTCLLEPALQARTAHPGRVLDVRYDDLVADPTGTVARIYEHFGLAGDAGMEECMHRWLAGHSPTRHGVHRYSLEQFGLTPDAIEEAFADYHERFALAPRVPVLQ